MINGQHGMSLMYCSAGIRRHERRFGLFVKHGHVKTQDLAGTISRLQVHFEHQFLLVEFLRSAEHSFVEIMIRCKETIWQAALSRRQFYKINAKQVSQ